ncbi:WD40-repeat-containing domain protein [Sphaerosporella brunnea]|uniref:Pre-rRNA-processing protein IPI3 n=1 Tax=Sphaerosporella brunnea TaxID=1250544 RepID=A0A5J5F3K8_9PEZI|nr:WD40-repeat-containing domain protein [Sphaerosporella brunnea]
MLTETLLLGTYRTPTDSTDVASISLCNLHSGASLASQKRSHPSHRGLAATKTHVFAQQSDKSVVNVYTLPSLTLESAIPFPEAFTVLSASPCGNFLAAGTEGGRTYVWELASGRLVATPASHLQRITSLAWAQTQHLVVGSEDTNVSVWSLPALLDTRGATRTAERVLDRHIHAITAVAVGGASSGGPSELLLTAARDRSVIAWELHTGAHLRTFLLPGIPLCLAVDPAERAAYVGLEEGGVVAVDFHSLDRGSERGLGAERGRDVPVTVEGEIWGGEDTAEGREVISLAVSYEGGAVVAGNKRGEVAIWDVATGCLFKNLCQLKAPVTSMILLPPSGFTNTPTTTTTTTTTTLPVLPKPKYESILAATSAQTFDPDSYSLTLSLPPLSTPSSTFGPEHDMQMILRGAQEMNAFTPAGEHRTEQLEEELAALYDSYERLAEVHRKTWKEMVGAMLEEEGEKQR